MQENDTSDLLEGRRSRNQGDLEDYCWKYSHNVPAIWPDLLLTRYFATAAIIVDVRHTDARRHPPKLLATRPNARPPMPKCLMHDARKLSEDRA